MARAAILVSNGDDLRSIVRLSGLAEAAGLGLLLSRIYQNKSLPSTFTAVGPFIGAPYSVMLLEMLIARGAREIVVFGWCGSLSSDVRIGDIVVPKGAFADEGTSKHYHREGDCPVMASPQLRGRIEAVFSDQGQCCHEGNIWTTDAIYRETPERVGFYQRRQALAVEMEMSALFSVGRFRGVDVAGVLVVSDELSSLQWRPGFTDRRFRNSRDNVSRGICSLSRDLNSAG